MKKWDYKNNENPTAPILPPGHGRVGERGAALRPYLHKMLDFQNIINQCQPK